MIWWDCEILHLHTEQMAEIHPAIVEVLAEQRFEIINGPVANVWDEEYGTFFKTLGIKIDARPTLYTSVHYDIGSNWRVKLRWELQVRTLSEELWGEVSHSLDYPHRTGSIACQERLKVLARVASSCTRLVDSIFRSKAEYDSRTGGTPRRRRVSK